MVPGEVKSQQYSESLFCEVFVLGEAPQSQFEGWAVSSGTFVSLK